MTQGFARFLYLNTYGFVFLLGGIVFLLIPLWVFSFWWLILQGCVFIACIAFGMHLLSMHDDKQRQYEILFERNKKEFHPESFSIYMDAPCGRKVVRAVLKDLNKSHEYKKLLKYKTQ